MVRNNEDKYNINPIFEKRDLKVYYLTYCEVQSLGQNNKAGSLLLTLSTVFVGAGFAASPAWPFWVVGGLSGAISLYFLFIANRDILSEFTRLKEINKSPPVSLKKSGIKRAIYGANGTWLDITTRVKSARTEGGPVLVSNGLAGDDPLPGTVKTLRVTYKVNGEEFEKDFSEGTIIELPPGVY